MLIDDRDERPGVKFKDADLIGIPLRMIVGRGAADGIVEVKRREEARGEMVSVEEALALASLLL
ncbi:Proline--tRNA ligase [compost metagenome]